MLNEQRALSGFTLIEILVSLLLGSILLAMVIGLYVNSVAAGAEALKISRLRTELLSISTLMVNDLRRAGYGGSDFMVGVEGTKLIDITTTESSHCVVYSYNYDKSLLLSSHHIMGFRYAKVTKSVQFGRHLNKDASHCFDSGSWINLNDPDFLKITALDFIEDSSSNEQETIRSVELLITGNLVDDDSYHHSINTKVKIRNIEIH